MPGADIHITNPIPTQGNKLGNTESTTYTGYQFISNDTQTLFGSLGSGTDIIWGNATVSPSILTFTTTPATGSYSAVNTPISISATTDPATVDKWEWYYTTDTSPSPASTWTKIGEGTGTQSFTPTAAGDYTFKLVVTLGTETTDSFEEGLSSVLHVIGAPQLTQDAAIGTAGYSGDTSYSTVYGPLNQSAYLSVGASAQGGGLTYQWYENGNPIDGAETAQYTDPNLDTDNATHTYYCRVSSLEMPTLYVDTRAVTLQTFKDPTVTASPSAGNLGDTITLTATGTGYASMQWQASKDSGPFADITGATTATYSYAPTEAGTYAYQAVFTYGDGSYTRTIQVTDPVPIYNAPALTVSPAEASAGDMVTLTATDTGFNLVQWQVSTNGTDYADIGNTNPYSYYPADVGVHYYRAVLTYPGGYTQTVTASDTVTIYPVPAISFTPAVGSVGDTITLTAVDTGFDSIQWQTNDGGPWEDIGTANPQTHTPAVGGTYSYRIIVTYAGGFTQTVTAAETAIIYDVPNVTINPVVGGPETVVTFTLQDTGFESVEWWHKKSEAGDSEYTYLGSGNPFSYVPNAPNTYVYKAVLTYPGGYTYTVIPTQDVKIFGKPALTVSPEYGNLGAAVTLTAEDTGFTAIQWKVSTDETTWTNLGTTNPYTYTPAAAGTYYYQAVVTYEGGYSTTADAPNTATLYNVPTVSLSATAISTVEPVTLTATDTGYSSVQWKVSTDGTTYTNLGTTNPYSYTPGAAGTYHYQAVFTYDGGHTQTVTATQTLTVYAAPTLTVSPATGVSDTVVTLTATGTGFTGIQWKVKKDSGSFTDLGTTNPYSYTPGDAGTYTYQAVFTYSGGYTQTVTADQTVTIYGAPTVTVSPTTGSEGDTVTLTAAAGSYTGVQWKVSTDGTAWTNLGTTNPYSYEPDAGTYYYQGVFTFPGGQTETVTAAQTVTIYENPVISVSPLIGFTDTEVTIEATDTGYTAVQWKVSTDGTTYTNLSTANPYTYVPGAEGTYHYQGVFTYAGGYSKTITHPQTVNIYAVPSATAQPTHAGLTDTITLNTQNLGSGYQWYYSGNAGSTWNPMVGATTAAYSLVPQTAGLTAGEYLFRAEYTYSGVEVVTTPTDTVYLYAEPAITVTPTVGGVADSVTITATATGYSSVQWQVSKDGGSYTNLSTVNPYTYTPGSAGVYAYKGVFTYPGGYTQTITAAQTVTIYAEPTITATPQYGDEGDTVTLTATDTGFTAIQWKVSTDGVTYTNLGTTNPYTYTPDAGTYYYQAVLTYTGGYTQTVNAPNTVTLYAEPSVTVTPTTGEIGDTITVTASDTGYTAVQWKVSTDGSTYTNLGTANPQTHTPTAAGTYHYQAVFTYTGGHTQTVTAAQTAVIYGAPALTVSPQYGGTTDTITLTATDTGFDSIQWKVSTDGTTWTNVGTSNPQTHTPGAAGVYQYQAVVTYTGGYTQTVTATQTATIYDVPTVTVTPQYGGTTDTVTLTATSTGYSGVQWQVSKDGAAFTNLGTTTPYTYTPGSAGVYTYKGVFTYPGGYTATVNAPHTVTIYAAPAVTVTPQYGSTTDTVTITATDTGFTAVQWKVSKDGAAWTNLGTTNPYAYVPGAAGVYTYQGVFSFPGGYTATVTAAQTATIYDTPALTITPTVGGAGDAVNLSATNTGYSSMVWQVSTNGTAFTDLSASNPHSYYPAAGTYYYRAVFNYGGGYNQTVTYPQTVTIYAAPTVTVSPTSGGTSTPITLTATDTGYTGIQWQVSKDGGSYTNLGTTNPYTYTPGIDGTYAYRGLFTYTGGFTQTVNAPQTVLIYADPIPVSPGGPTAPVAVPYQITLTAAVTNPGSVVSYYWQVLSGGSWVHAADGPNYQPTLTTPGNYIYRFVAVGHAGQEIPSPTITVDAGYAPSAVISIPAEGASFDIGSTINITAAAGGSDATYTFDFGNRVVSYTGKTGTVDAQSQEITATVTYELIRDFKTIKLTVSNRYGTSATDTVQIVYGQPRRPAASSELTRVDTTGLQGLIEDVAPQSVDDQMPNITKFITDLTKPFTDVIGEWFWLLVFAVPFLIMWIRQKNLLIPSILGVLFAAWLLVFLPGTAMKAAIGIIILAVAGGIYGLYVRTHRT